MKFLKALWKDESGQTTTEYILIVAGIVAVVAIVIAIFHDKLADTTDTMTDNIDTRVQKNTAP